MQLKGWMQGVPDVSGKLKTLREKRQLTMRELAAASGVSASLISKIEAGKVSPTVMSLQKMLDAMDVDLYEFFLDKTLGDPSEQVVFKRSDMFATKDDERTWFYALPKHPDIRAELTYEEYQPHTKVVEKESHSGDTFGMVIAGELTLEIADKGTFLVGPGDAFYLKAGWQHVARNDSDEILRLIVALLR
jgi:transcriptional regulator with XRE-family HTH domain